MPKVDSPIDVAAEEVTVTPPPVTRSKDPLYHEAVRYLMTCTIITPEMLCTRFNISKERASQLIGELMAVGVIGADIGGYHQILIPHRSVYEPQRPFTGQRAYGPTTQQRPVSGPNSSGFFKWFWIILIIFAFLRTCG